MKKGQSYFLFSLIFLNFADRNQKTALMTDLSTNNPFPPTRPKEELAALPAAPFEGNIRLIDKEEDVARAVAALRSSDIVGFDTETRPNFKKGQNHRVSLIQLSTRSTCYLFRINKIGLHAELRALLEDPDMLKVGLSLHDDFHNLRIISELNPAGFIDLQKYVGKIGIEEKSLAKIYGIMFGKRISKGQRLTNWEADELSEAQQRYAALDAMACIEIYERVNENLSAPTAL